MINSVYFICCPAGIPEKTGYEHQIISIVEGLKQLGVKLYSNINYWKEESYSDNFLLLHDPRVEFADCDVVVFSSNFLSIAGQTLLPASLFNNKRKYKLVFIDQADGFITQGNSFYNKVDLVLKSHFNTLFKLPSNVIPWQFGLTNRIIQATSSNKSNVRRDEVLFNFRVHHPIREKAKNLILPLLARHLSVNETTDNIAENESELDRSYWHQTGRRHYANYYKRLTETTACACFGGYFQKSIPFQGNTLGYYLRHLDYKFNLFKNNRVYQYDSWRFWESLAAGCCTFHIDLEKYGAVLPVMPINGVHYLGVDFDNPDLLEKQLMKGVNFLQQVGEQGRKWVLHNYSSEATATRFLNLLTKV